MTGARDFFRRPFGSALLGGAVVGLFGWIAIAAGWIEAQGGSTTTVAAPLAAPAVSKSDGGTNVVNQIYRNDGQGVAFIQADQPAQPPSPFDPFGEPQAAARRPAPAS